MGKVRAELLISIEEGRFLSYLVEKRLGDRDELFKELIKLQNEGIVDVVSAFKELENNNQGRDFFLTRDVFAKLLPEINAPVLEVMECVLHISNEAGQDMTADFLFTPYIDFCAAEVARPKEALALIEKSIHQLSYLLTPTIVAGARLDIDYYLNEAIRLAIHRNGEIRQGAFFSLGQIHYPEESPLPEQALATLENAIKRETDDGLIASIIKSAFSLYRNDKSLEVRVTELFDSALAKGGDATIYAASVMFGLYYKEIPATLLDVLLLNLQRVNPQHQGTLDNIDFGLEKLIREEDPEKGINFVENLLVANADTLSFQAFDSVITELIKNNGNLLNRLMTRWFLRGDGVLCNAIYTVVKHGQQDKMFLAVERSELPVADFSHVFFLARKAIGYLFSHPVTAASIILSLIPLADDKELSKALSGILFEPLLLNYPGKVKDYLEKEAESEIDSIRTACNEAIVALEQYLDTLKSTGDIPELYPSQSQREAYHRHFSRQMAASMKQSESKSVFLSLVSKSIILYGRKSICYVYGPDGQANRMETLLQHHSTEVEFPRCHNIDMFGLDYMLRVFRVEKMRT